MSAKKGLNEYTFLTSKSFRTDHVYANNLRDAARITKKRVARFPKETKSRLGIVRYSTYQTAKKGDFTMSGWRHSYDKKLQKDK